MSVGLTPFGNAIVVGYEDDADGSMRVRIASSSHPGLHVHLDDEASKEKVRAAWGAGGHVFTTVSDDAFCVCPVEVTA